MLISFGCSVVFTFKTSADSKWPPRAHPTALSRWTTVAVGTMAEGTTVAGAGQWPGTMAEGTEDTRAGGGPSFFS